MSHRRRRRIFYSVADIDGFFLLLETGDFLLLETGDRLILE